MPNGNKTLPFPDHSSLLMQTNRSLFLAAFTVGTMDGIAAVLTYLSRGGNDPSLVFKFISGGLLGRDALTGGFEMVIFGALLHFMIAMIWSFIFFRGYPVLGFRTNKFLVGAIYGIFVWLCMNLIVVPLSNTPGSILANLGKGMSTELLTTVSVGILIHVIAVGLPISLIYHRSTRV